MISLIIVNFRSAQLAREAIRTARQATQEPLQVIAVDNSCDPSEAAALEDVTDELIVSAANIGYASAINAARRAALHDILLISNADVRFSESSLDVLCAALENASVAGPALFWDDAHRWILPPADAVTARQKLDEILASRSRAWAGIRDRRRVRARVAFWMLRRTVRVQTLSGAVFAVRRDAFDSLGGLDERFPLYFEETDFFRRLRERRGRIAYVPNARVRHLYNQSAAHVPGEASSRYVVSEMRYLEKWNGPLAARFLKSLERPLPALGADATEDEIVISGEDMIVEASPLPSFATAAGHFPDAGVVRLPEEILRSFQGELYLRTVSRTTGEVFRTYRITV
jgi:N-acetylglucosaminyl-diphospho-decaprenol L-rhamnosyltransferase